MRRAAKIGALAGALTFSIAPSPVSAEAPRELAFVRGDGARSEIYVARDDGSRVARLTTNRFTDYAPTWSPDGARILFVSTRDGDDEIFVMDASGRNVRQLTRNRRADLTPRWSRDGRWIAFASDRARPGEPEIWLMRSDGSGARRLVRTPNHAGWQDTQFSPVWSPDGTRLIFSMSASDSNPELYSVSRSGTGLRRLTRTAGNVDVFGDDTMPDWSSDGSRVLFVSNREQRTSDVWTMRSDGSAQHPLARRPTSDEWHPRLSPDGTTISFTHHPPTGPPSVWVMNADGGGARRVTAGAEADWKPAP